MPKVMVVDDTEVQREALVCLLRRDGYETLSADNAADALRMLRHQTPDLLLDVNMPGVDGLDLLEMLRDDARWESVPVIMVTGCNDADCVERAERLGATEYILKGSFSAEEMLRQVKRLTRQDLPS